MSSIFRQIFLAFWITTALVALVFLLVAITSPQTAPLRRFTDVSGRALAIYAQTAAETYEHDGPGGLNAALDRMETSAHLQVWLFDSSGHLLSAGPAPPRLPSLIPDALRRGQVTFHLGPARIGSAQSVTGPSGARYVLVGTTSLTENGGVLALLIRLSAVLLVTGLVCWLLARSLVSPILVLRSAAQRYASGDLSARAGETLVRRRDEIGELGRDFDLMASRLENLAVAQRQLLGDISHELRSPLARLVLALALARRRGGDSDALDRIEREAARLDSLIDRLLIVAQLDSGLDPTQTCQIEFATLVQDVADDAQFEARSLDRHVEYQGAASCGVRGMPDLLRSAVENIVRNALRYTPPGSSVEMLLECSNGWARLMIRDYGPGVPEEDLSEIFRPFRRVGEARDRSSGGVGLGLSITERAVRLHGGTVTATNIPESGGLRVEICLPTASV